MHTASNSRDLASMAADMTRLDLCSSFVDQGDQLLFEVVPVPAFVGLHGEEVHGEPPARGTQDAAQTGAAGLPENRG